MSLYDMYFSKKNKNHIFNIITNFVIKETSIDINSEQDYIDLYRFKYSLVFERSLSDNLIDLNKELIDEIVPLYINDIKSKRDQQNIKVVSLENKENKENTKSKLTTEKILIDPINNIKKEIYINSSDRLKESINRYNYKIKFKENISLLILQQIMLPEENNILFENPIICIQIVNNEKIYNIFCSYEKNINLKNKRFTLYKPSKLLELPINDNQITIKILTNTLNQVLTNTDKININKIKQIDYHSEKYLCLSTKSDNNNLKGNTICIYSDDKLIKICKVDKIKGKFFLIKNEDIEYYKDKNYYLLVNNLQNDIVFLCE